VVREPIVRASAPSASQQIAKGEALLRVEVRALHRSGNVPGAFCYAVAQSGWAIGLGRKPFHAQ
jgi:hypothetical protein